MGKQTTNLDIFISPALHAPEIDIRSDFGPEVDIWSVGLLDPLSFSLGAGFSTPTMVAKTISMMTVR